MQQANKQASKRDEVWEKIKAVTGLYRYKSSGTFFANVRKSGKLHTKSLRTDDLAVAKRKLHGFKAQLDRTDPKFGRVSFCTWLEDFYAPTLKGADSTLVGKRRIIDRIKETWLAAKAKPMNELRPSEVERWLVMQFGQWTSGYFNTALMLVRDAFAMAVRDHALMENPAAHLKYRKRTKPIRLTPTWEEAKAIVESVREQRFNADCRDSANFLDFLLRAGVGQAEASAVKREHVDLEAERILLFRQKTRKDYWIPIYPWLRPLVEKLCTGKRSGQHLLAICEPRKALTNACTRLKLPHYTPRSLRRCFITRAIELGVDIKVIAFWQNHADGGKLLLDTYSHVRPVHAQRMAALLTEETPANVIPLSEAGEQESKSA
jgi:Site-specific recombinase XerD